MHPTLTPAYGRDYKSKKAVLADFNADKDFILADISSQWDGKPCNRSGLLASGVRAVNIRYKSLRQICVVKL